MIYFKDQLNDHNKRRNDLLSLARLLHWQYRNMVLANLSYGELAK